MQQGINNLSLHPDIQWIKKEKELLQIRQPNGEHITFDNHVEDISNVLNLLQGTYTKSTPVDEDIMRQVIELLISKGFLVDSAYSKSQFERIADLNKNKEIKYKESKLPRSVFVTGEGKLSEILRESLAATNIKINKANNPNSLKVVIADQDNHEFLRAENKKSVNDNQFTIFFRWTGGKFRIGPLLLPNESACLECAYQRELGSSLFPNEMNTYLNTEATSFPNYEGGPVLDSLAASIIIRQIILILRGDFDLLGTSNIITIDPLTLNVKHSSVLKLPRCKVCGSESHSPSKNLHDLINETN
ncbi:TOMM precursor leader peptide-binding protein [Tenacibaculum sp. M341]|uniref:TOMM precursor leader peptide-binding protein n=1 Tax=Tenacibaculum sp. M341 TaxID=2530339 RepID=UPI001048491F|nr:TOMM precursor leader peptide-binding protein [Tenacibaculum sp. M341]TCI93818.1 TOMM precursor leader peptide-binding protein [Tenacibaculum sp. M341]